jgi:hypothetical protein
VSHGAAVYFWPALKAPESNALKAVDEAPLEPAQKDSTCTVEFVYSL